VSWSAVRELARVATAETELEWLAAARGRSVHEVERLVSGRRRGARPGDEPDSGQERYTLRFDVSAETFATIREAMRVLRQRSNGSLDDDSALLLMARVVLGGPADEGKHSYQIAVNLCERCGRGGQDAAGEVIPVDASIVDMARCDAQHIGRVAIQSTHVGENGANGEHATAKRATQTIPPALRRKVLRRDHGRCVVPGCRHATFVDVHHLEVRADGGTHDEENLVVLCSAHHRAVHRGQLEVAGSVSRGLVFLRGDGAPYGTFDSPHAADGCERAFRALRSMGFGETRGTSSRRASSKWRRHRGGTQECAFVAHWLRRRPFGRIVNFSGPLRSRPEKFTGLCTDLSAGRLPVPSTQASLGVVQRMRR
jgi:hypothetical protein